MKIISIDKIKNYEDIDVQLFMFLNRLDDVFLQLLLLSNYNGILLFDCNVIALLDCNDILLLDCNDIILLDFTIGI